MSTLHIHRPSAHVSPSQEPVHPPTWEAWSGAVCRGTRQPGGQPAMAGDSHSQREFLGSTCHRRGRNILPGQFSGPSHSSHVQICIFLAPGPASSSHCNGFNVSGYTSLSWHLSSLQISPSTAKADHTLLPPPSTRMRFSPHSRSFEIE